MAKPGAKKSKPLHEIVSEMDHTIEGKIKEYIPYLENTPEAAKNRQKAQEEFNSIITYFNNAVQYKHFKAHRGEQEDGAPKSLSLHEDETKAKTEIDKLLLAIAAEAAKRDLGEAAAKQHVEEGTLQNYVRSKGINYDSVVDDLLKNKKNVEESEEYQKFKRVLAQNSVKYMRRQYALTSHLREREHEFAYTLADMLGSGKIKGKNKYDVAAKDILEFEKANRLLTNYVSSKGELPEDYLLENKHVKLKKAKPK